MECVAIEAVDFKFPFTGKTYKKGEEFSYEIVYVEMMSFFFFFILLSSFFFWGVVPSLSLPLSLLLSLIVRYLFPIRVNEYEN